MEVKININFQESGSHSFGEPNQNVPAQRGCQPSSRGPYPCPRCGQFYYSRFSFHGLDLDCGTAVCYKCWHGLGLGYRQKAG